jgi:GAF domain-containing protein
MENDHDIQRSEPLYPSLHATSIIENLFKSLGLNNTHSLDDAGKEIGQRLHHKSWMVRLEAVKSLGTLGKQAELVLMQMVHDENECVRLLAQYELQRLVLREVSCSIPGEIKSQEMSSCPEVYHLEPHSLQIGQEKECEQQQQRYTLTWRELLEVLLEDPYALEKVTKHLGVSRKIIMNWIHYKADPDLRILQQIIESFPDDYDALLELIQRELPHFVPERLANGEEPLEILAPFHNRLSKTLRESPPMLRFWSTCQLVLRQAMQQLDPYRTGMMMAIMICTAPAPGKNVRSLYGYLGSGSSAWTGNWYQQPLFFGSDSLSGYAATTGAIQVIHDVKSDLKGISFYDVDDTRSVLVIPILSSKKCAGCLYVTSTSPYYFGSRRLKLVQEYTECLARAFSPEEFYAPDQIQLSLLPYKTQISFFKKIKQLPYNFTGNSIINWQEKQKSWNYIEDELISFLEEHQEPSRTRFPAHRPIIDLEIQQARHQVEAELFALLSAMSWSERRQDLLA